FLCRFHPSPLFSHFFSFHSSAHHLHLHSFPTRRSSDLARLAEPARRRASHARCRIWISAVRVTLARAGSPKGPAGGWSAFSLLRDRKSTRLNSSHRTISYAVFCLKKKKKKTVTREERII